MSDESNEAAPGPDAPVNTGPAQVQPADDAADALSPDAPSPATPAAGRWPRVLPPWVLRRPRITATGAGVLVTAVIALVVFEAMRPSAPRAEYTSLPQQPCALVSSAELARYLPGATGTPVSIDNSVPTTKAEMSLSDSPFASASLSRADKLAADIAMIRDMLANLRPS